MIRLDENLLKKWEPVLNHEKLPAITDNYRKHVTATLLENTEKALSEGGAQGAPTSLLEAAATNNVGAGNVNFYDPVLISLVRRSMPNLIAYDICGVQPMTGPTGLIFAMRSRYGDQSGAEAFYNEANTGFSTVRGGNTQLVGDANLNIGANSTVIVSGNAQLYNYAGGMTTAQAEGLGTASNVDFANMSFTIEKIAVTARSRALKAEYTIELAQDLKAIHGLDAETELANILSTEVMAEINREVVRMINVTATPGAQNDVATAGTFDLDVDSNGRWSVEKFKGLMFQLERECNAIAKATRRGKGNIMLCSSDVASALQMAGVLDYNPAIANNLQVDDTGNTFAGVVNGRIRVYIDPYSSGQYATVGYRGSLNWDAGVFYCPYVPLQMVRAVGQSDFQPRIGFKTRYGIVANPFSRGATASDGTLVANSNVYYRRILINNLM